MKVQTFGNLPRLLVVICFAAFLASCSSSSTTDTVGDFDINDINQDGVVDLSEGDHNDDGVVDDSDLDFNGDGVVNLIGDDVNDDGFVDFADFDVNGDGFTDASDDTNSDGMINSSDATPTDLGPCGGVAGTDENSSNNQWDDNCLLSDTGPNSAYNIGIQRILSCQGYGPEGQDIAVFADGNFGPNTKAAVIEFQNDKTLTPDGLVGPDTWGALRDELVRLDAGTDYDTWGFLENSNCNGQALFYQKLDAEFAGVSWEMAQTPGSTTRVAFGL